MSRYFIDHPVFAWVIAILIVIAGVLSIRSLGVESYPNIAPPQVTRQRELSGRERGDHREARSPRSSSSSSPASTT